MSTKLLEKKNHVQENKYWNLFGTWRIFTKLHSIDGNTIIYHVHIIQLKTTDLVNSRIQTESLSPSAWCLCMNPHFVVFHWKLPELLPGGLCGSCNKQYWFRGGSMVNAGIWFNYIHSCDIFQHETGSDPHKTDKYTNSPLLSLYLYLNQMRKQQLCLETLIWGRMQLSNLHLFVSQ